jgi:hypothetical protein
MQGVKQRGNPMKQKRIDTLKGIRAVGKLRFIFAYCCIFYCLVSIVTTLRKLWPDGEFMHFDDFIFKILICFVIGVCGASITWNINENKLKKINNIKSETV